MKGEKKSSGEVYAEWTAGQHAQSQEQWEQAEKDLYARGMYDEEEEEEEDYYDDDEEEVDDGREESYYADVVEPPQKKQKVGGRFPYFSWQYNTTLDTRGGIFKQI